jgi:hypothetical protein
MSRGTSEALVEPLYNASIDIDRDIEVPILAIAREGDSILDNKEDKEAEGENLEE